MRKPYLLIALITLSLLAFTSGRPVSVIGASSAQAAPSAWSGSIVVFNPRTAATNVGIVYLDEKTGTSAATLEESLAGHASRTYLVGSTLASGNFSGSAIVSAVDPVLAIYKQAAATTSANPSFYSSANTAAAGLSVFFPNIVHGPAEKAVIGIQNAGTAPVQLTLNFYPGDGGAPVTVADPAPLAPLFSRVYDTSALAGFPPGFDGSLVVTGDAGAKILAAVQQQRSSSAGAYSYEGVSSGADAVFAPSVECNSTRLGLMSTLEIQNTGSDGQISVAYHTLGEDAGSPDILPAVDLPANYKLTIDPCSDPAHSGRSLSAVIHAANGAQVAAVVKTRDANQTLSSASIARPVHSQAGPDGKYRTALPYVYGSRSDYGYQTYIEIMNLGDAGNTIVANYYTEAGSLVSQAVAGGSAAPLAQYITIETSPGLVGGLVSASSGDFSGAVIVESAQPVAVVARVERRIKDPAGGIKVFGDEYEGIPYDQ